MRENCAVGLPLVNPAAGGFLPGLYALKRDDADELDRANDGSRHRQMILNVGRADLLSAGLHKK